MATRRPKTALTSPDEAIFAVANRRSIPFDFVLAELEDLGPHTKPMFGCTAVYIEEKIVFILRDRPTAKDDNGVWLATVREHHESLRAELPSMRSIGVLGAETTGWQILPVDAPDFEEAVLHACALVKQGDPRIGKEPKRRVRPQRRSTRRKATRR